MPAPTERFVLNKEREQELLSKGFVDAVWVLDAESLHYVYISPTVEKLRGFTAQEVIDSRIHDHLTPASRETAFEAIAEELERYKQGHDVSRTLELEMYRKDGSITWIEITARFYNETNGALRIFGISRNIDDRKLFERSQKELIDELKETVAERDRLLKENKILMGLLPICAECKKIRDEKGRWWEIESYIASRTEAQFTHTLCPPCMKKLYPELYQEDL